MLIRDVDVSGLRVYRRVGTFVLAEVRVAGSYHQVWGCLGSGAAVMAGRACRIAEITHRELHHAAEAGARPELCVSHVQPVTCRVYGEKFFVQEAAESEAVEGLAIRADRGHDWLAAPECGCGSGAHHLTSGYRHPILWDEERDEDAAYVEVCRTAHRVGLNARIAGDDGTIAAVVRQTAEVPEALAAVGGEPVTGQLILALRRAARSEEARAVIPRLDDILSRSGYGGFRLSVNRHTRRGDVLLRIRRVDVRSVRIATGRTVYRRRRETRWLGREAKHLRPLGRLNRLSKFATEWIVVGVELFCLVLWPSRIGPCVDRRNRRQAADGDDQDQTRKDYGGFPSGPVSHEQLSSPRLKAYGSPV